MKKIYFVFLLLAISYLTGNSQNFNRPVPLGFHQYEYTQTGNISSGYYLTTPFLLPQGPGDSSIIKSSLYLLDKDGYLTYYYRNGTNFILDAKFNKYTNRLSFNDQKFNNTVANNIILDSNFNIIDSHYNVNSLIDIHDYITTKEKGYVLSARIDSVMDLSAYTFNGSPGDEAANAIGYVIQEFDSNKNLIFQWNSNDYIHPSEMVDGYPGSNDSAAFDYAHGNSIDKDDLGNYYISLRHTNAIYKISPTGDIIWQLGGKSNSFTFTNDSGFSGQHDARIQPNGNITLYDNGNTNTIKKSRGVEYSLDTNTWIATKVKEYNYPDSIYARAMGSYQTCSNDHNVLNYGLLFRPSPSVVHIDSNQNILAEIAFSNQVVSYRTFFYPTELNFIPVRPEITCKDTTGGKFLSAPDGHTNYVWSTGDSAQHIFVSQSGEYQAWVNYGIGMLGTAPITVDINTLCNPSASILNNNLLINDEIVAYYNLLGKKIEQPLPNQVNIIRYKSGKMKKIFIQSN